MVFKPELSLLSAGSPESSLLIFDRRLDSLAGSLGREVRAAIREYPFRYGVDSGEPLKDLAAFPMHVAEISRIAGHLAARKMTVIAFGGGSVGDFAGFFASVYRRGVRLVHVPSTWLAAIDSSHGGKTALNVAGAKNQIGTFYQAEKVVLCRSILMAQPQERVEDAMGELGKIALIDGGKWVRSLEKSRLQGPELLWEFLEPAIESKLKIVRKDPREKEGLRQVLNLGHTVGHVFESAFGWSHGFSVAQGLFFAVDFSEKERDLDPEDSDRAFHILSGVMHLQPEISKPKHPRLSSTRFRKLLLQDKKRSEKDEVTYVFLAGIGKVERKPMKVDRILREAQRQGWVSE